MTFLLCQRFSIGRRARLLLAAMPLLLGIVGSTQAQNAPAVPSDVPPRLERLEEGQLPDGTIRKPDGDKSPADTRDPSGAVTETRVETGRSTYYVRPNKQVGNAQPGDLQSSGNRAAQFKIKEFDLGRKKAPKPGDASAAPDATPAPPAMPARN